MNTTLMKSAINKRKDIQQIPPIVGLVYQADVDCRYFGEMRKGG